MTARRPADRFTGAMLGLACGDALGAPAEFLSPRQMREKFGRLTTMVGGGSFGWAPGEWTDDTGMALCVAEGILKAPEDPVVAVGKRFVEWRKTAKDVGGTISAALAGFHGDWTDAGRGTPQARDGKAAGNGSLMRTLPVALAYPDRDEMLRQSARISAMTHWDPQAEVCCGEATLEDALVAVVNLAGETDTMAAVAGGVGGAASGVAALPDPWLEVLHKRERIERAGRDLAAFRHRLVYRKPNLPEFAMYEAGERLLAGRNPLTGGDVAELLDRGVTAVLDLRQEREWARAGVYGRDAVAALSWCGVDRLSLPVPDAGVPGLPLGGAGAGRAEVARGGVLRSRR